jgi:uncharacterized membrane protein YhiD involved in acid resistance
MTLPSTRHTMTALAAVLALAFMIGAPALLTVHAQPGFPQVETPSDIVPTPDRNAQIDQLRRAATRLPIAAALAVLLAMRPRRKGTPHRRAAVIQTQVILAIIGAVVMLIVGASLARAFGIVGAAGLVRYRAKIDDPKDAGVMLSTLAIGLASGVGLWMLAVFTTVFIMLVLGIIESFEPKGTRAFTLEIKAKDPEKFKPKVEEILTRARLEHTLRTASEEEICYEVNLPLDRKTDRLTEAILKLDPENVTAVDWKEPKSKK